MAKKIAEKNYMAIGGTNGCFDSKNIFLVRLNQSDLYKRPGHHAPPAQRVRKCYINHTTLSSLGIEFVALEDMARSSGL